MEAVRFVQAFAAVCSHLVAEPAAAARNLAEHPVDPDTFGVAAARVPLDQQRDPALNLAETGALVVAEGSFLAHVAAPHIELLEERAAV